MRSGSCFRETFDYEMHLIGQEGKEPPKEWVGKAMATIVEYSSHKQAVNAYPAKIVSPPAPRECCSTSTVPVGEIQEQHGWPFVYLRCEVCGYTVRYFAPHEGLLETRRSWRGLAAPRRMWINGKAT